MMDPKEKRLLFFSLWSAAFVAQIGDALKKADSPIFSSGYPFQVCIPTCFEVANIGVAAYEASLTHPDGITPTNLEYRKP